MYQNVSWNSEKLCVTYAFDFSSNNQREMLNYAAQVYNDSLTQICQAISEIILVFFFSFSLLYFSLNHCVTQGWF